MEQEKEPTCDELGCFQNIGEKKTVPKVVADTFTCATCGAELITQWRAMQFSDNPNLVGFCNHECVDNFELVSK